MANIKIGIIGGTGLDDPSLLQERKEKEVTTTFGKPSDALITGKIGGVDCVLLARHGRKHELSPSKVNYRANILALKNEGCTHIIVSTACGSLREDYKPGQIVVIDQFIDRTYRRDASFYDGTNPDFKGVCHISASVPFCTDTRKKLLESLKHLGIDHHESGTMVCIEGPRFSTKAESNMFRQWQGHLINMTTVPEVMLAKEAGLCYAACALVTDYDCWREGEEHVTVDAVMATMKSNAQKALKVILDVIPRIAAHDWTDIIKAKKDEAKSAVM